MVCGRLCCSVFAISCSLAIAGALRHGGCVACPLVLPPEASGNQIADAWEVPNVRGLTLPAVKSMIARRADVGISLQQFFYKERDAHATYARKLTSLAEVYEQLLPPKASGNQIADAWEVFLTAVDDLEEYRRA